MKLSIGKLRGLQQISTADGILVMCAMDHRGSLQTMIDKRHPEQVSYDTMVAHKLELCSALAPHASAVLLDPIFGAAQCIGQGVLPGKVGLLVSMEATGYSGGKEGRVTRLLEGWSVEKVRRLGGSAAKLLLHYRPDLKQLAAVQQETVRALGEECIKYDLPLLVEPVSYPVGKELGQPDSFAASKPSLVIETAREIAALPIDVLKAEFPADLRYDKDEGKLRELCRRLDEACRVPWVILSAGVDYDAFRKQVEIACRAGASGFLGGRAIWQEAMVIRDASERRRYLSTVAADRLKRLSEIACKYAEPWHKKLKIPLQEMAAVPEDWHARY